MSDRELIGGTMDFKLEQIIVPVSDLDRAKAFYLDNVGFELIVDFKAGADFRVVQFLPQGSACAVTLMCRPDAAGSVQGLHLVVSDIEAARSWLVGRGVAMGELFHFDEGREVPGPDPERGDYNTFCAFSDPDGTGWLLQEVVG
jgi:catechol 2,3-dioxygenase-like lactoylglutathione lyase family enzyme